MFGHFKIFAAPIWRCSIYICVKSGFRIRHVTVFVALYFFLISRFDPEKSVVFTDLANSTVFPIAQITANVTEAVTWLCEGENCGGCFSFYKVNEHMTRSASPSPENQNFGSATTLEVVVEQNTERKIPTIMCKSALILLVYTSRHRFL